MKRFAKFLKSRVFKIIVLVLFSMSTVLGVTYAATVAFTTFTHGNIEGNIVELNVTSTFQMASGNTNVTFTDAGMKNNLNVSLTNSTNEALHYYYQISYTDPTNNSKDDSILASAILVYFNDTYVGTLDKVTTIDKEYMFLDKASFDSDGNLANAYSLQDKITLELHNAFDNSILNSSKINVQVSALTESYNYSKYALVRNESEFKSIIDDINSLELTSSVEDNGENISLNAVTIVLMDDINLTNDYTISDRCKIISRNHTLSTSGTLTLDNENSLVIFDLPTMNIDLTLDSFDQDNVNKFVISNLNKLFFHNVTEETDLSNALSGYGSLFTYVEDTCEYANYVLTPKTRTLNKTDFVTFDGDKVYFKVGGSQETILDSYFVNMPSTNEVISHDIYLPTRIQKENASITWTSSNPDLVSNDGRILTTTADEEDVTLYAEISVNDHVYTKEFSFKVSLHISEVNFFKLIGEISPIVLYTLYQLGKNGQQDNSDYAYYRLPVVNNEDPYEYDYRRDYVTPNIYIPGEEYNWQGQNDIRIDSIRYEEIYDEEDPTKKVYDFISLEDDNAVVLVKDTLNTYAKLKIIVTQDGKDIYEGFVRVIVAVGSNTEVLEPGFHAAKEAVSNINILYNIISSRIENGYSNASADFYLPAEIEAEGIKYEIRYSVPSVSSKIITEITKEGDQYKFSINPKAFSSQESMVSLLMTVYFSEEIYKTRTVYFNAPAVYDISDIGNPSLFNTVQYQIYKNLSDFEQGSEAISGFTYSNNILTNTNDKYILIRDLVGDEEYIEKYLINTSEQNYLEKIQEDVLESKAIEYAALEPLTELKFLVTDTGSVSGTSDRYVYDFVNLLAWATSASNTQAHLVINNTSLLSSSLRSTISNGKEYISDSELAVLKNYYMNATKISESEWNKLKDKVFEDAPGYLFEKTDVLNSLVKAVINTATGNSSDEEKGRAYFKYVEVLQWASNEKNFGDANDPLGGNSFIPNLNMLAKIEWTIYTPTDPNYSSVTETFRDRVNGNKWVITKENGDHRNSKYAARDAVTGKFIYDEDETDYISSIELEILKVFLLNFDGIRGDNTKLRNIGPRIVEDLDKAVVLPRFLISDGVATIVNQMYKDLNITDGEFKAYMADRNDVPRIVNMDSFNNIVSTFEGLTTLTICGDSDLSLYLDKTAINNFYNKLTNTNKNITELTMSYVANDYVTFDVSSTKNLKKLEYLDLSNNTGITNVGVLVSPSRINYTYVDISGVGVEYRFLEYAVDNLSNDDCIVWYTDENSGDRVSLKSSAHNNDVLTNLDEFTQLIVDNMFLIDELYNVSSLTDTGKEVYWIIEDGNDCEEINVAKSEYEVFFNISDMEAMISPYFYCSNAFSYNYNGVNFNFKKNYIYRIEPNNRSIRITELIPIDGSITQSELNEKIQNDADITAIKTNANRYGDDPINDHRVITLDSETESSTYIYETVIDNVKVTFNCMILAARPAQDQGTPGMKVVYFDVESMTLKYGDRDEKRNDDRTAICLLSESEIQLLNSGNVSQISAHTFGLTTNTYQDGNGYYIYNPYYGLYANITNETDVAINLTTYAPEVKIYGFDGSGAGLYDFHIFTTSSINVDAALRDYNINSIAILTLSSNYTAIMTNLGIRRVVVNEYYSYIERTPILEQKQTIYVDNFTSSTYEANFSIVGGSNEIGYFNCFFVESVYDKAFKIALSGEGASTTNKYGYENYLVFLTQAEYNALVANPNKYKTQRMGTSILSAGVDYYIYNPCRKMFLTEAINGTKIGTSTNINNAGIYNVEVSGNSYRIKRKNSTNYLYLNGTNASSYGVDIIGRTYNTSNPENSYLFNIVDASLVKCLGDYGTLKLTKNNVNTTIENVEYFELKVEMTLTGTQYINKESTNGYRYEKTETYKLGNQVVKVTFVYYIPQVVRENTYFEGTATYNFVIRYRLKNNNNYVNINQDAYDVIEYSYLGEGNEIIRDVYDIASMLAGASEVSNSIYTGDDSWAIADYQEWKEEMESRLEASYNLETMVSYVTEASEASDIQARHTLINNIYNNTGNITNTYYVYTGDTGKERIYSVNESGDILVNDSKTYVNSYGYHLGIENNSIVWVRSNQVINIDNNGRTMVNILDYVNRQFELGNYREISNYYGRYYIYTGNDDVPTKYGLMESGCAYKIVFNEDKNGLTYEKYDNQVYSSSITSIMMNTINGVMDESYLGNIVKLVNNRVYVNGYYDWDNNIVSSNTYRTDAYYIITYNDYTGSYYLRTFTDVTLTINDDYTILGNNRIYHEGGYYGGTGGSIPTVISAFVVNDDGTVEIRRFSVLAIG